MPTHNFSLVPHERMMMKTSLPALSLLLGASLLLGGCGALKTELADTHEQLSLTQQERDALQAQLQEREGEVQSLTNDKAELERLLSERAAQLKAASDSYQELQQMSTLQGEELDARLAELRSLREQSQRSQRLYESLIERFRSMIDAGQLQVTNERGRLVINLPQDILFSSGSASLGREGITAITEVGSVLATIDDRRFQVEGHTDNIPISTSRFPSNWELSSARALAVVKLLVDSGVGADSLSGAGFGEFAPRVPNDTASNREQNRRIEIVLVPDLDLQGSDLN